MLQANHRRIPREHTGENAMLSFSKSNPATYSFKMHRDQVGFMLRIQGWLTFENLSV